jgi:hypothetical protein
VIGKVDVLEGDFTFGEVQRGRRPRWACPMQNVVN